MANTYAANFGDTVKHSLLAATIERELPERYLESHGGRLDYRLDEIEPGPGGVWDFLDAAADDPTLATCAYTQFIRPLAGSPAAPGTYPGSIAIADGLLPARSAIIAFELVAASAASLADGLAARGRTARVHVGDGLAGVVDTAGPADLVLLDPFDMYAAGDRFDSLGAFDVLARNGVRTVLWYPLYTPGEPSPRRDATAAPGGSVWHARFIGTTAVGGLAGCGWLTANLSPATARALEALATAIAAALGGMRPGLEVTFT